jgi:dolichol-phosphate mannosyltransferase
MKNLTVILPALNEELAIGKVIDEIRKFTEANIIVANNGSTDKTKETALSKGVHVLDLVERGKGRAIREALKLVTDPYCVILDSDYTYPAKYIPSIVAELQDGADIVLCYRAHKKAKAMPMINSLGNELLSILASLLYNHRIYDVCTGMWGFSQSAIEQLNIKSVGFTLEADLFTNAKKRGIKIAQIPIEYRTRLKDSHTKLRLADGFKIAWFLLKHRLLKLKE